MVPFGFTNLGFGTSKTAAAEIFKSNYKKYPNTFTTNMGMARAMSTERNFKEAVKFANAALSQAPDAGNKANIEKMIEKLKAGKDANQ